jgi:cystathionine beta-lyase
MAGVLLGPIRLLVDHRVPGSRGGPTLRVLREQDGRELLRFDCFVEDAHWHLDPSGRDEVTPLPPSLDSLEWSLTELRADLVGYLDRAGFPIALDRGEVESALARIEPGLRNPPAPLDDLDVSLLRQRGGEKWALYPEDVLPLWVADMDFPVAKPIERLIQRGLDLGDLGYPLHPRPTRVPAVFARRAEERFGWSVEPRNVELITDVVQGLYVALHQFSAEGEGVVVQTPIYPPFLAAVREMRRTLVENPLMPADHGYTVDLEGLRQGVDGETRILLLCSPHNPSGRVFRRRELEGIAEIALARGLLVVSDEIHADLVYSGSHHHIPFASLAPEVEARTITLTSASKPFNIAGLRCAVAIFGSPELRKRFLEFPRHLRGGLGSFGIAASEAAWRHSQPWLDEVLAYLEANRELVAEFAAAQLPAIRQFRPEATYLAWLDCRELGLEPSPYQFFLKRAKVALSDGAAFGEPGRGFVRLNFATSRRILRLALERMAEALRERPA